MKRKQTTLFSKTKDLKLEECISHLNKNGYGVFKLDSKELESVKIEEMVRQLTALGYKVIRLEDRLEKVDVSQIGSSDDVVKYFYELVKRNVPEFDPTLIPKTPEERLKDRSVVNSYINTRVVNNQLSQKAALEELFKIITILFEIFREHGISINGFGILSINGNRGLVNHLLSELRKREDQELNYKFDKMMNTTSKDSYNQIIEESLKRLNEISALSDALGSLARKKIKMRGEKNNEEKD